MIEYITWKYLIVFGIILSLNLMGVAVGLMIVKWRNKNARH